MDLFGCIPVRLTSVCQGNIEPMHLVDLVLVEGQALLEEIVPILGCGLALKSSPFLQLVGQPSLGLSYY